MNKLSLFLGLAFATSLTACSDGPAIRQNSHDTPKKAERKTIATSNDQCRIKMQDYRDEGTLVLNDRKIDFLMRGDIIDAPISLVTKKDGTRVWILPTALQQNGKIYLSHTIVRGDLYNLDNSEIEIVDEEDLFSMSDAVIADGKSFGRHWITNIVQTDDGLLALIHLSLIHI